MPRELFSYAVDENALKLAQMMDGKLLLVTNVPDMNPEQVIARYKSLADIERGFKVLKSELEIGPVYHRLPERIRAHAAICFMALVLHPRVRHQNPKSPIFHHPASFKSMSYGAFFVIHVVAILIAMGAGNIVFSLLHFTHVHQAHSFRRPQLRATRRIVS